MFVLGIVVLYRNEVGWDRRNYQFSPLISTAEVGFFSVLAVAVGAALVAVAVALFAPAVTVAPAAAAAVALLASAATVVAAGAAAGAFVAAAATSIVVSEVGLLLFLFSYGGCCSRRYFKVPISVLVPFVVAAIALVVGDGVGVAVAPHLSFSCSSSSPRAAPLRPPAPSRRVAPGWWCRRRRTWSSRRTQGDWSWWRGTCRSRIHWKTRSTASPYTRSS